MKHAHFDVIPTLQVFLNMSEALRRANVSLYSSKEFSREIFKIHISIDNSQSTPSSFYHKACKSDYSKIR